MFAVADLQDGLESGRTGTIQIRGISLFQPHSRQIDAGCERQRSSVENQIFSKILNDVFSNPAVASACVQHRRHASIPELLSLRSSDHTSVPPAGWFYLRDKSIICHAYLRPD